MTGSLCSLVWDLSQDHPKPFQHGTIAVIDHQTYLALTGCTVIAMHIVHAEEGAAQVGAHCGASRTQPMQPQACTSLATSDFYERLQAFLKHLKVISLFGTVRE